MENLLTSYVSRIQDLINWITSRVAGYLAMESVDVSMVPFKLLDDDNLKSLMLQLVQLGKASEKTLFEELGLDWNDEQDRIKEELVTRSRLQVESQYEADQAQFVAAVWKNKRPCEKRFRRPLFCATL